MTGHACVSPDDLIAVQDSLSATVLPGKATRLESMPPDAYNQLSLAAEVRLWGGWHGQVAVCMSATLARAVAAQMQGLTADEINDEMSLDAVAEIANVTAGSVKALLPSPTNMALPTSLSAFWEDLECDAASNAVAVHFRVDTGYFSIAVLPGAERSRVRRGRLG